MEYSTSDTIENIVPPIDIDKLATIVAEQSAILLEQASLLKDVIAGQKLMLMLTSKNGITIQHLSGILGLHHNTVSEMLNAHVENEIRILRDDNGRPRRPYKVDMAEAHSIKRRMENGEKFSKIKTKK